MKFLEPIVAEIYLDIKVELIILVFYPNICCIFVDFMYMMQYSRMIKKYINESVFKILNREPGKRYGKYDFPNVSFL